MLNTEACGFEETSIIDVETEPCPEGPSTTDAADSADEEEVASGVGLDAESLFADALAGTTVLTRAEEEVLARQIVRARRRVHRLLRGARRLSQAALRDQGRGVVTPEQDFREREAVTILGFARRGVKDAQIQRLVRMDRSRLRAYVHELEAALAAYRGLRDQMVRANVRLVNVLARRYRHPTLSQLDLFQEGSIGLIRAIEKFDPERNIKFSTYAVWWIWQQLGRAADTQGSLIRTPVHWNQLRRRLGRDEREIAAENDGCVARADLAARSGLECSRFETMAQEFYFVSTDAPVNEDSDRVLESLLPGDAVNPEDGAVQTGLRRALEAALAELPERERLILRRRFGLAGEDEETLEEIGVRLGVSRERIRQLESRALKQLHAVCTARGLTEYLN